jgi:hypothetical protein
MTVALRKIVRYFTYSAALLCFLCFLLMPGGGLIASAITTVFVSTPLFLLIAVAERWRSNAALVLLFATVLAYVGWQTYAWYDAMYLHPDPQAPIGVFLWTIMYAPLICIPLLAGAIVEGLLRYRLR